MSHELPNNNQPDVVRRLDGDGWPAALRPLLNYARIELQAAEARGDLPFGELRAEDLVDSALVDALADHRHLESLPPYPTLRRLVRRALTREIKARRRVPRTRSLDEPIGRGVPDEAGTLPPLRLIDIVPDPRAPIPETVAESKEFQQALASLLCQLPITWREPFLLHIRDNLPLAEVAHLEGVPESEVRHRIEHARAFLRERLAEEYEGGAFPPPTETLFDVLHRVEPAPALVERWRAELGRAPDAR